MLCKLNPLIDCDIRKTISTWDKQWLCFGSEGAGIRYLKSRNSASLAPGRAREPMQACHHAPCISTTVCHQCMLPRSLHLNHHLSPENGALLWLQNGVLAKLCILNYQSPGLKTDRHGTVGLHTVGSMSVAHFIDGPVVV